MSWLSYWPLLLGYPALFASIVILVVAISRRSGRLALWSIVPALPMGLYVLGSPGMWWLPPTVFIPVLALAGYFRRQRDGAGANRRDDS